MLKSWSVRNFKAIVATDDLLLAPITVVAGLNSSGKTSLLQSLLMIAQTLGSRLVNRPLLPNERIVQLGTFEDILTSFSQENSLHIGFGAALVNEEEYLYDEDDVTYTAVRQDLYTVKMNITFRTHHQVAASPQGD